VRNNMLTWFVFVILCSFTKSFSPTATTSPLLVKIRGGFQSTSLIQTYSNLLKSSPIFTKSLTAGLIFGLSDITAQKLENNGKRDVKRTLCSAVVGFCYFGPAAHYWYETIFRLLPSVTLLSTLTKATLGQLLFGPSFTAVFFAASMISDGTFSIGAWFKKLRADLPQAWIAGIGFWPFVDLISYSYVKPEWIPLFINSCSFLWTVYLSGVVNKRGLKEHTN